MKKHLIYGFVIMATLLWLWPNLVHEPSHYLIAKLNGVEATINYDWSWPATPTITRHGTMSFHMSLLFLIFPSIVNLIGITILFMTRQYARFSTHVVLATYLFFDVILNVLGYRSPTNDFHFLTLMPFAAYITAFVLMILAAIYFQVIFEVKQNKRRKNSIK